MDVHSPTPGLDFLFVANSVTMPRMHGSSDVRAGPGLFRRSLPAAGLVLILLGSAYLRFEGLGLRSLWRDELCTWHVSRMDLGESLRWGPELTKPPLYQFLLRGLTFDPHPSEWTLRFPAAACGVLSILAACWFGAMGAGAGWRVGLALAGLLACNALQIEYSQEGRPYTLLVLGCLVSTALWYRMVVGAARRFDFLAYVVATVLTLYANYLAVFTIVAQFLWWTAVVGSLSRRLQPARTVAPPGTEPKVPMDPGTPGDTSARSRRTTQEAPADASPLAHPGGGYRPVVAMAVAGMLCLPLVVRYLALKSSIFQGLEWIAPPTWRSSLDVLERLTFGWQWVWALLVPGLIYWIVSAFGMAPMSSRGPTARGAGGSAQSRPRCRREDICGLLLVWLACAWFGLLVVSWIAHPAMVARYALPASVPALLLPLVVASRVNRHAPLVMAAVFMLGALPDNLGREVHPGLRELAAYLQEQVDPKTEVVVLTLDNTLYPGWEDSERLGFLYYPLHDIPLAELPLDADGVSAKNRILDDPRGLYLVVLWADPFPILEAAGREAVPIMHEGRSYSQLLFTPYRLVRVAALRP